MFPRSAVAGVYVDRDIWENLSKLITGVKLQRNFGCFHPELN